MQQALLDARENVDDMDPTEQVCSTLEDQMFCFAMLVDSIEGTIHSNLPGRFLVQSYTGKNYIFVAYIYKINAILIRSRKNRSDGSMIEAFREVYDYLQSKHLHPKLHVLDSECSQAVKIYIRSQNTDIQLVEPHNHRVNAAETAVKAIKYHIIAGLATVDGNCPLQLWDAFLPQIQDTLNLLCTSR